MKAESADLAVRKIARTPALLAEARDKAGLIARLTAPLSEPDVYEALQPCLILWGAPDHGDGPEAAAADRFWLATHTKAYRNLPREALDHGVSEFIRTGKAYGFPKPSDIVRLAEPKAQELRMVAWRIQKAAEAAAAPKPVEMPAEVREANKARLADLAKTLAAKGMAVGPASRLRGARA